MTEQSGKQTQAINSDRNSTNAAIARIVALESEAIANIPLDNPFESVTDAIHEHCAERGGKLILTGVGKAGEIATKIATTFASTGTPSAFLHPLEAAHGDLGVLQANDLLLAISNSGKTREILELIPLCQRLVPGMPVIALTGEPDSALAGLADFVLRTGAPPEACPLGLTPTTSTTVMTVIGDILVSLQIRKLGFTREDYARRHHGGYLGQAARKNP